MIIWELLDCYFDCLFNYASAFFYTALWHNIQADMQEPISVLLYLLSASLAFRPSWFIVCMLGRQFQPAACAGDRICGLLNLCVLLWDA